LAFPVVSDSTIPASSRSFTCRMTVLFD
jgi:hypothetical protein